MRQADKNGSQNDELKDGLSDGLKRRRNHHTQAGSIKNVLSRYWQLLPALACAVLLAGFGMDTMLAGFLLGIATASIRYHVWGADRMLRYREEDKKGQAAFFLLRSFILFLSVIVFYFLQEHLNPFLYILGVFWFYILEIIKVLWQMISGKEGEQSSDEI